MKIISLSYLVLFLLLASLIASGFQQRISLGQTVGGSAMVSGVLAHGMSSAEAQALASSNITWVSCDVTFDASDISQWGQVYSLAQQYHLNLLGILDQHLMNYSTTFTLADWSNAVTQAVVSFSDVKAWEIWNEPSMPDGVLGYYNGSAQAYVAMLQVAYNDITAVAPTDTVIGLGGMPLYDSDNQTTDVATNQAFAWANQTVRLGAMNYCDAIGVHAYPYGLYLSFIAGASFTNYIQKYSQLCGKPIWVTEVGQESFSTTWAASETQQSTFLSQSYSLFQGLGAKAYFWYELSDNYTAIPDSNFGLFDNNGNAKTAFDTFAAVVNGSPSPTASPTAKLTASPIQTPATNPTSSPSPSPSSSQSPTTQPTSTPGALDTAKPFLEENYAAAIVVMLTVSLVVAVSVYLKKHRFRKTVP